MKTDNDDRHKAITTESVNYYQHLDFNRLLTDICFYLIKLYLDTLSYLLQIFLVLLLVIFIEHKILKTQRYNVHSVTIQSK